MTTRDDLANARVQLRKVMHTRLGMPDTVEVWDRAAGLLGFINATEGAIWVSPVAAGRPVTVERQGPTVILRFATAPPEP